MSHLTNLALDVPVDLYLGLLSNLLDVTAQVGGDDRTRSNQTLSSLQTNFWPVIMYPTKCTLRGQTSYHCQICGFCPICLKLLQRLAVIRGQVQTSSLN